MSNYDFHQLNDKEFEFLICDLLSKEHNTLVERFKPWKDWGIDGRFFKDWEKNIIQAKHYLKTGFRWLLDKLQEEFVKVQKINPKRYIIATSLQLNNNEKQKIRNTFWDYIINTQDILWADEVNYLLSIHADIENAYYKLRITSSNVLMSLINNAIVGRSQYLLESIQQKSYKYTHTENHTRALELLKNNNIVIISWEPGIGKTTLAENLSLYYVSKWYKFFDIEESLSEAENVYQRWEKQLFYFDDFLGSNFFEAIENKKDSHITKFIERIKNDNNKKFILTSRTNILNNWLNYSHILKNSKIQKNEFMLTIEGLKEIDKARILYNHIFFSNLSDNFKEEIFKDKRYKEIINHKNFNPRLIEFITDIDRIPEEVEKYRIYIHNSLENPKDIRSDSFHNQSDEYIRNIVLLCVFNGWKIKEQELRDSFYQLNGLEDLTNASHTDKAFNTIIKLTVKCFLNRNQDAWGRVFYTLFNPSIADFILHEYKNNTQKLSNIYLSLNTISSLSYLWSLWNSKLFWVQIDINQIKDLLLNKVKDDRILEYDYIIYVMYFFIGIKEKEEDVVKQLNNILSYPKSLEEHQFSKLIALIKYYINSIKINMKSVDFWLYIKKTSLDYDDIQDFVSFLNENDINNEELNEELKSHLVSVLVDKIIEDRNDIDFRDMVEVRYDDDWPRQVYYEEDEIYKNLSTIIENYVGQIDYTPITEDIDIDDIIRQSETDINRLVEDYLESSYHEDSGDYNYDERKDRSLENNKLDAIDDLFEKV